MMSTKPVIFEDRTMPLSNGCLLWMGHITSSGYGMYYQSGKRFRAHRYAYESKVGPIPDGLVLDHLCRNRACVNPDHLEPVTHHENVLRGEAGHHMRQRYAARTHCSHGHEFTPANTRIDKRGTWRCLTCRSEVREAKRNARADDCLHAGRHTRRPNQCIDCARLCSDSWATEWFYTENGAQQRWGGVCSQHGEWSESAA